MKKLKLIKINPISAFKTGLGLGAILGIIAAIIYILIAFIGGIAIKGILGGIGGGIIGIFVGVFFGVLNMLGTGVVFWLYALIYNAASNYMGPLEIEVSGD